MTYDRIKNNERAYFLLLRDLDKVFKNNDIDYWLECGTLIGAIREGTYLEWDGDMDISIHFKDIKRVRQLKKKFEQYDILLDGFVKSGVWRDEASICIFPLQTIKKNNKEYLGQYRYPFNVWIGWIMDLLYAGKKFERMLNKSKIYWWICSKIRLLKVVRSSSNNLGNFAYIDFCGTICPIPEHVEDYLEYVFGDWRTSHKFDRHNDINNMYYKKIYK